MYRNRTSVLTLSLTTSDGETNVAVDAGDTVRYKVFRRGDDTPLLELVSGTPTANGSSVTVDDATAPAAVTVLIDQDDAGLTAGVYGAEYGLVDSSDSDRYKHVHRGLMNVISVGGGDT